MPVTQQFSSGALDEPRTCETLVVMCDIKKHMVCGSWLKYALFLASVSRCQRMYVARDAVITSWHEKIELGTGWSTD